MSELESLFSAAAPNSDSGGSGCNSNRRASGPKSDKVHLVIKEINLLSHLFLLNEESSQF